MAKSGSERQAQLRDRVRKGELKRLQVYLIPEVSDALDEITRWQSKTKTEVIRDLVLASHRELAKQHRPRPKLTITIKDVQMKKQTSDLYDIRYRQTDTHIGYANKRSDKVWMAYASPDQERFEGKTRTQAVSKFIKSLS